MSYVSRSKVQRARGLILDITCHLSLAEFERVVEDLGTDLYQARSIERENEEARKTQDAEAEGAVLTPGEV